MGITTRTPYFWLWWFLCLPATAAVLGALCTGIATLAELAGTWLWRRAKRC